jgi:ATP-binding cassette subfamily C protein
MAPVGVSAPEAAGRLPVASRSQVREAAWRLLRHDRRALLFVVGLYCLAALVGLAGPWLVGEIVDRVRAGAEVSTIDRLALAIAGFVAVQVGLERAARYAGHRLGERALARLREGFVEQTLALPMSTVEHAGSGDLMTRSTGDVNTVGPMVRDAAPEIFLAGVQVAFLFGAVFVLHPLLGLCALVGLPPLWLALRWYLRRARTAYLAEGAANTEVIEELAATADGARTVEALGLAPRRSEAGDTAIASAVRTRLRTMFLRSVLFPVLDTSHTLPMAAMLLVGGGFYLAGTVSLGAVVAAVLYLQRTVGPLETVTMWVEMLQRGGASLARVHGVGLVGADRTASGEVPVDDRLVVDDVRYAYREGHDVLHGVAVSFRPGERLAVVGPSGAGKSTLARLLAGIDPPRLGRVAVGGVPVTELPLPELRSRVALVTQDHHVFIGTLRDNLLLARPAADDRQLRTALAAVHADWIELLPDGLDTAVGAGGMALDPGQAQQVALARLILADPHTVILDEATSLLDPSSARRAERALAAVLHGRTVIVIAHRLQSASDADRVAVVDRGRLTELGSHDQLLAGEGSYAALWRAWHGGGAPPGVHSGGAPPGVHSGGNGHPGPGR